MSLEMLMYMAGVSENLQNLIAAVAVCAFIGGGLFAIVGMIENEDRFRKFGSIALIGALVGGAFGTLLPSKETLYSIAGVQLAKEGLNSQIGQKIKHLIESKIDNAINEVKKCR
jgi:hypothetical protein